MDANTAPTILVETLRARGLSVTDQNDGTVSVINPLNPHVSEAVEVLNGAYLIDGGYEVGVWGDETATAERLSFLLGLTNVCEVIACAP
ncbi:hypothetical protein ACFVJK_42870 [Streptomyces sp. NPDC127172]|uniref:hypothetical protein n=1 Tax=Streptomyces sp. NPDC127172 TaxID=3345382 RepID=UPI003643E5F0